MAMQVSRWNSPDDGPFIIAGKKCAFAKFSWEAGDTYNATTRATTKPFANGSAVGGEIKPIAGANPIDLWGIRFIHDILWDAGGSSDAQIPTGSVMPVWNRNLQAIILKPVGSSGTGDPIVPVTDAELTAVAENLSALQLYGLIFGE